MIAAMLILLVLGIALGGGLGVSSRLLKVETSSVVAELEEILPGTNCGQCGYPGCSAAAQALSEGTVPANFCPPGGRSVAREVAARLGIDLDVSGMADKGPVIAFVMEDLCIGCTKCLKRCPTDAIVGASRQMHGVVDDACTGCEVCASICPTGAIVLRPEAATLQTWHWPKPVAPLAA